MRATTAPSQTSTATLQEPTRILYYIAYPHRMAGANRSLFELVTNLPTSVTPIVAVVADGQVAAAYRDAGVETHLVAPDRDLSQFGRAMFAWSYWRRARVFVTHYLPYSVCLACLIRKLRVDLIHVNDVRGALMIAPVARLTGRPVVSHLRGEITFGSVGPKVFETSANAIITVCSSIQSSLTARGRAKATTVYNGIASMPSTVGSVSGWLEDCRKAGVVVVSCFASIVPFKGHWTLLAAIGELNRRGSGSRALFLCIGDWPIGYEEYQERLLKRQRELGLRNLTFAGWQPVPEAFYRTTDVCVLTSVNRGSIDVDGRRIELRGGEGLPRTHLEAMSHGLPVVSTNNAGVREQVVDGVTGFVVDGDNAEAVADALETMIVNPGLRQQMGEAGQLRVRSKFSTDQYVRGVLSVYRSVLPGFSP